MNFRFLPQILAAVVAFGSLQGAEVGVRKNAFSPAFTEKEWDALKHGIDEMRHRPDTDPTSWAYQGKMHGTKEKPPAGALWNQCQHGSYFFLAWHRMYLYYFERILRKASGLDSLRIPYWDPSVDGQNRLPEPFVNPANEKTNPLFNLMRNPDVNEGQAMSVSLGFYDAAFAYKNFSHEGVQKKSFGGMKLGPIHTWRPHGQFESQPHDGIHTYVGGQLAPKKVGWLADPNTAALDPLFWLHHSNADRLWEKWLRLGEGRANPVNDEKWMTTRFNFFDENGQQVSLSAKDVLDTAAQLGYRYDDVEPLPAAAPVASHPAQSAAPAPVHSTVHAMFAGNEKAEDSRTIYTSGKWTKMPLKGRATTLEATLRVKAPFLPDASRTYFLELAPVALKQVVGVVYEVYVNLPEGAKPDPRGPYYCGNLTFFDQRHGQHRMTMSREFDATKAIQHLAKEGRLGASVRITFFRLGAEGKMLVEPAQTPMLGRVRIAENLTTP